MRTVIMVLLVALLTACGSNRGPQIENGVVTQTLVIPAGKDMSVAAEVMVVFAGSPDDKKAELLWKTEVRPAAIEAIKSQSFQWVIHEQSITQKLFGGYDAWSMAYSNMFCKQIKQSVHLGSNPLEQCLLSKIEKFPTSDIGDLDHAL